MHPTQKAARRGTVTLPARRTVELLFDGARRYGTKPFDPHKMLSDSPELIDGPDVISVELKQAEANKDPQWIPRRLHNDKASAAPEFESAKEVDEGLVCISVWIAAHSGIGDHHGHAGGLERGDERATAALGCTHRLCG
ncbi:hypothetical protein [Microvirga yunnanensis]|uniref:hypothetical protein n=1 Tax=Microvirga yunnanensis TaxID=2953740 RepID=UPI0021C857AE|nr:hypothetical protein [Microvirga sp. HBU65207]